VGYGPTLKLARKAFAVKRELTDKPLPEQGCGRPGGRHVSNGAPTDRKEESYDAYAGYYVRGIHGGEG
jgi:hypothetical protein